MTGGSLPAMTWRAIMTYAHQGIELKNIAGIAPNPPLGSAPQAKVAAVAAGGRRVAAPGRADAAAAPTCCCGSSS